MGNFRQEIQKLKQQLALQPAETVARLKKIEGDLCEAAGKMEQSMREGFARFEEALTDEHKAQQKAIDRLLDQVETFMTDELKEEIAEEAVQRVQKGLLVRFEELQIRLERLEKGTAA